MSSLNYFSVYAEVNDVLFKQINDLKNRIYDKAKHEKKSEDNLIRKCPFCKEIWVKVSGCNGSTRCGERETRSDKEIKEFNSLFDGAYSWINWSFV